MFLTDNAKVDGTPNKAKLNERYTLVFILFEVLKILLIKKIQLPVFLFLIVFYQLLHQQISFLQHFSTSFNTASKKIFVRNFSFFLTDSPQSPPNILHRQGLLNMTKVCFFIIPSIWLPLWRRQLH